MLPIPEVTGLDVAFGNIKHMPKYDTLPRDYQNMSAPACRSVSQWFYSGAKGYTGGIEIDGVAYKAKTGVDASKALAAIKSILGSFAPKHEHKIAGCGFLLNEWFDRVEQKAA